jgi:RHS repeat-associated protein
VKPDDTTGVLGIVGKWDETNDQRSYRLYLDGGIPKLDLSPDGGSGNVYTLPGTNAVPEDEWSHVAAVRNGNTVKLYVNRAEEASGTYASAAHDGDAELVLGSGFDGMLDEVRISGADKSAVLGQVDVEYTHNARNQLVTESCGLSVRTYSYDKNGNTTGIEEKVGETVIATETMTYDELNRMTGYAGPRGSESFGYRGAEWHRYSQTSALGSKHFLYDGDNVLADIAGGAAERLYVTPFLDQNLSMTITAGDDAGTYYYSQDGLGSVRTLTDSLGNVENRYDYTPFGGPFAPRTSVTVEQRHTYTGRERNPTLALMYYRYRQYDARVGRFGGRDPIGYAGDIGSLYIYCYGNPITSIDPMGDFSIEETAEDTIAGPFSGSLECTCGRLDVWAVIDATPEMGVSGAPGVLRSPGLGMFWQREQERGIKKIGAVVSFRFTPNNKAGKEPPCCCTDYAFKQYRFSVWTGRYADTGDPEGWYKISDFWSHYLSTSSKYGSGTAFMIDYPGKHLRYVRSGTEFFFTTVNCYPKPHPKDHEPYADIRWYYRYNIDVSTTVRLRLCAYCN